MSPPLRFTSVSIRALRNLARVELTPAPRLTVIAGDNGQGKTSLLEALYLAGTTRSFRTARLRDVLAHGAEAGSVKARFDDGLERREQVVGLDGGTRRVLLDGKRPPSLAAYAVRSPIVAFHPGETALSSGSASGRRTLLDRIALFEDPTSMDHHARYAEATRARRRVLETRGVTAADLDAFEHLMGVHGAALTRARRAAALRLAPHVTTAFARITREARAIELAYEPGGPELASDLEAALRERRERDRHRGAASVGPHRDELALALGGFGARADASQGEHRAITLALKLAELTCIADARGVHPVLLLDDVSSELDPSRTAAFFEVLFDTPGQIVLTTTRPELIHTPGLGPSERTDVTVVSGQVLA